MVDVCALDLSASLRGTMNSGVCVKSCCSFVLWQVSLLGWVSCVDKLDSIVQLYNSKLSG